MKKAIKELRQKDLKELIKEEKNMRDELAKSYIENKVNPAKDTNGILKNRKKIAQILTVIKEKNK